MLEFLQGLYRFRRQAATHVIVSPEQCDSKPYAIPVQCIPYVSLKHSMCRNLVNSLINKTREGVEGGDNAVVGGGAEGGDKTREGVEGGNNGVVGGGAEGGDKTREGVEGGNNGVTGKKQTHKKKVAKPVTNVFSVVDFTYVHSTVHNYDCLVLLYLCHRKNAKLQQRKTRSILPHSSS